MDTKILFTDLDGTLLNEKKQVSPLLTDALMKLLHKGHILVLSSGRPLDSILEVKAMLGLPDENVYISAYNGSLLYDCKSSAPMHECRVSFQDAAQITQLALQMGVYCQAYTDDTIITPKAGKELSYYRRNVHLPYIVSEFILDSLDNPPFKLLSIDLECTGKLYAFQKEITALTENRITTIFSNDYYMELFSADSGKGTGLITLCSLLNIPVQNTMAAGDAQNDISMLQACGYPVAMQNARAAVKEAAAFVTERDNNEDGLLPAVMQYFEL